GQRRHEVERARLVGQRQEREHPRNGRIEPGGRNLIVCERLRRTGLRIVDHRAGKQGREVTRTEVRGRNDELARRRRRSGNCSEAGRSREVDSRSLIIAEEEGLVASDRSSQRAAELIELKRRTLVRKEVARVEHTISEELEQVAMKLIGAAFGA